MKPPLLHYSRRFNRSLPLNAPKPQLMREPFDRVVSRVSYKPDFFTFEQVSEPVHALKQIPYTQMTFGECAERQALNLLRMHRPRYFLSYSGGIDSTGMLVAILSTWPTEELEKITLVLSSHSIAENPTFFDRYLSKFPRRSSLLDMSQILLEQNAVMVTGELGDQLFGSDILAAGVRKYGDTILWQDYREGVPRTLDAEIGDVHVGRQLFEHFHPIVAECPFPIRSVFDFFWWFNFTQKWQFVKYRFTAAAEWNLQAKYGSAILHFYDTIDFQLWSLNNHDLKIEKTWDSYKIAAKKYIFDFTKDQNHLNLKKVQSLKETYYFHEKRLAVRSDLTAVNEVKDLESYIRHVF